MEENNKPFACSIQGCGMTFTNEDHLTVHKKKHDMSLNFGNGQKPSVFVADQTPTPTRFIRNCEEVGLFQDLQNVNPFEEQFRKATEAAKSGAPAIIHEMDPLVGPQPDDMLHTPHVFPHIETVPSGSGAGPGGGRSGDIGKDKKLQHESSCTEKTDSNEAIHVNLNDSDEIIVLNEIKKIPEARNKEQENETPVFSSKSPNETVNNQTSEAAVHVLIRLPDGRLVQLSGMSVESPPPSESTVGPISLSPNWQLTNNLQVTSNLSHPVMSHTKQIEEPVTGKSQGLSFAKLKLKEVLLQNSSVNKCPIKKDSVPKSWAGQKFPTERSISIGLSRSNSQLLKIGNSVIPAEHKKPGTATTHKRKKRATSPEHEDGLEKRLKFLERNRAAASRCREKRKNWIKNLQRKSVFLETNNIALQTEVANLRSEVAQLRTLLLAHKECSVTISMQQQQQQSGQLLQKDLTKEEQFQKQQGQNVQPQQQKKTGTVIRRHIPKLSIENKSPGKSNIISGDSGSSQVLVMSSTPSLTSQHGSILQRQQNTPAIGQTAVGTVLIPSTPESAKVGTVCELQPHRESNISDQNVEKTVAVVVANPTVVRAMQISALNSVPVKLICGSQQNLAESICIQGLKEDSVMERAAPAEKNKGKLTLKKGEKLPKAM